MKFDIKCDTKAALFGVALMTILAVIIVKGAILETIERFSKTGV